ncbi:hypothetical protein Tco_0996715, partial [Tanacetum coccineum]
MECTRKFNSSNVQVIPSYEEVSSSTRACADTKPRSNTKNDRIPARLKSVNNKKVEDHPDLENQKAMSDNSFEQTTDWQPKANYLDTSLNKTKQVLERTGKLFVCWLSIGDPQERKIHPWKNLIVVNMETPGTRIALEGTDALLELDSCDMVCSKLDIEEEWLLYASVLDTRPILMMFWDIHFIASVSKMSQRRLLHLLGPVPFKEKQGYASCALYLQHSKTLLEWHSYISKCPLLSYSAIWENYLTHDVKDWGLSSHIRGLPPAGKMDITFISEKSSFKCVDEDERWIIASQDETTGPSVHPEDATSTKMVRETLSHADAESGGNSENVGSNSEQSHVAFAGPNPEHMHDVFLDTNYHK